MPKLEWSQEKKTFLNHAEHVLFSSGGYNITVGTRSIAADFKNADGVVKAINAIGLKWDNKIVADSGQYTGRGVEEDYFYIAIFKTKSGR